VCENVRPALTPAIRGCCPTHGRVHACTRHMPAFEHNSHNRHYTKLVCSLNCMFEFIFFDIFRLSNHTHEQRASASRSTNPAMEPTTSRCVHSQARDGQDPPPLPSSPLVVVLARLVQPHHHATATVTRAGCLKWDAPTTTTNPADTAASSTTTISTCSSPYYSHRGAPRCCTAGGLAVRHAPSIPRA
jgi:hypothetical protein